MQDYCLGRQEEWSVLSPSVFPEPGWRRCFSYRQEYFQSEIRWKCPGYHRNPTAGSVRVSWQFVHLHRNGRSDTAEQNLQVLRQPILGTGQRNPLDGIVQIEYDETIQPIHWDTGTEKGGIQWKQNKSEEKAPAKHPETVRIRPRNHWKDQAHTPGSRYQTVSGWGYCRKLEM